MTFDLFWGLIFTLVEVGVSDPSFESLIFILRAEGNWTCLRNFYKLREYSANWSSPVPDWEDRHTDSRSAGCGFEPWRDALLFGAPGSTSARMTPHNLPGLGLVLDINVL